MSKNKPLSVVVPELGHETEPLKIEFVWNSYLVVITRLGAHQYTMAIFEPKNDGAFHDTPLHTVDNIGNLMKIRSILENLFEEKKI